MKRQEIKLKSDKEMRALLESLGMSPKTIERAIEMRKQHPQVPELALSAKSAGSAMAKNRSGVLHGDANVPTAACTGARSPRQRSSNSKRPDGEAELVSA